jgi:hypothetical protein
MSLCRALLAGLVLPLAATAASTPPKSDICNIINSEFPGKVGLPNSSQYTQSQNTYFAFNARDVTPACVFRPGSAQDVAKFVKLAVANDPLRGKANLNKPLFAIRSGGHTLWQGAANAQGGVTVDMRGFDSIKLSDDKKLATIGGGSNFAHIYPQLVPHNLTVIGGRVPGVAAGGFLTGGGKNFLARRHGFGCDNIFGYEVVLASGEVVYASASQNSDLWLALKGGSNNFGIVTRYDLATYPLEIMWGGTQTLNFTDAVLQAEAEAFAGFMRPENFDDAADAGVLLGFVNGNFFAQNTMFYSKREENPKCFQPFTSIKGVVQKNLKFASIAEQVEADGAELPDTIPR